MAKNKRSDVPKNQRIKIPRVLFQKAEQEKKTRKMWMISISTLALLAIVVLASILMVPKRFHDKNGFFSLKLPAGWVAEGQIPSVQFDSSLGDADDAYSFKPERKEEEQESPKIKIDSESLLRDDATGQILKPDQVQGLKVEGLENQVPKTPGTIMTMAVFKPSNKKLDTFFNSIGGVSSEPKKYFMEELPRTGIRIPGVENGFYTFEKGWPLGIIQEKGIIIVINGSGMGQQDNFLFEGMLQSITMP